jgi:hypothetical protein
MSFETSVQYKKKSISNLSKKNERNKAPSEIERWAMGLDESENINCIVINYDSDEYDSIDDSYLENMVMLDKDEEEKNAKHYKEPNEERFLRVKSILDRIKGKKNISSNQIFNDAQTNETGI